jgi:hypothetical protein
VAGALVSTVGESISRLSEIADELDRASKALSEIERDLEPVEQQYEKFVADHEIGLWTRHNDEGAKFPPAELRKRLAHKAMDPALLGSYVGLLSARKRGDKRVASLKAAADAQRSILSALKTEAEALR